MKKSAVDCQGEKEYQDIRPSVSKEDVSLDPQVVKAAEQAKVAQAEKSSKERQAKKESEIQPKGKAFFNFSQREVIRAVFQPERVKKYSNLSHQVFLDRVDEDEDLMS